MALSLDRFALVDWVQLGNPPVLVGANGVDQPFWTDGLVSGRSEATVSTTAPDTSGSSAADANAGVGAYPDATDFTIFITYVRAATSTYPEMESGPCDGITHTTAAASVDIALSSLPESSDTQVTHKRIYIKGSTMEIPYYVDQITDATTSYTIDDAEATLRANDALREANVAWPLKRALSDALPPIFKYLAVWNQRLFASNGSDIYFSEIGAYFEDFPTGNVLEIEHGKGGAGVEITQLVVHKGFLYAFFEDAVYAVSGTDRTNFTAEQVASGVGCGGGPKTVRSIGDYLYWPDRNYGPMRWLGTGDPDQTFGLPLQDFWNRVNVNALRRACAGSGTRRREIIWHLTEDDYDRNNRRLVVDAVTGAWSKDHAEATATGEARNASGERCLLEGTSTGDVLQYDIGDADGVYDGTMSGTPTTKAGVGFADTAATFGAADDVEGRPLYFLDSAGDVIDPANRVMTRTSATELRPMFPVPSTASTYLLGGIPLRRASGPITFDTDGPVLVHRLVLVYVPTTNSCSVYVDLKDRLDSTWEEIGSFDTQKDAASGQDGRAELVVGNKRTEGLEVQIRCDSEDEKPQIVEMVLKASPAGGD